MYVMSHHLQDLSVREHRRPVTTKTHQNFPRFGFDAEVAHHLRHLLGVDKATAVWVASVERLVEYRRGPRDQYQLRLRELIPKWARMGPFYSLGAYRPWGRRRVWGRRRGGKGRRPWGRRRGPSTPPLTVPPHLDEETLPDFKRPGSQMVEEVALQ